MKNKVKRFKTDFLFTVPSFINAIGSIFSLYGFYYDYNTSEDGTEADNRAISSDWNMIGQDLNDSIMFFRTENELEKEGVKKIGERRQLDLELDV